MAISLLRVCITVILFCISSQSVLGQTVDQGEVLECESIDWGSGVVFVNYKEHGQSRVKIDFHIGVDGPNPHYDCFSVSGFATCIKRKHYKKYGIPKSAEGASIITDYNVPKIYYVLTDTNGNVSLFEKELVSVNNKHKFKKIRKCEDVTEYY